MSRFAKLDWAGFTLDENRISGIVDEVKRICKEKRDFVVDRQNMAFQIADGQLCMVVKGTEPDGKTPRRDLFAVNPRALRQAAQTLGVSVKFIGRLMTPNEKSKHKAHPDLVCTVLNTILEREPGAHTVRVLDGKVRACLSSSYECISNWDTLAVGIEAVKKVGGEIWDLRHSDDGSYFSFMAFNPDVRAQLHEPKGGWRWKSGVDGGSPFLYPAFTLKNGETGTTKLEADIAFLDGVCLNFNVWLRALAKVHLGARKDTVGEIIYSADTREKQAALICAKINDAAATAFDPAAFQRLAEAVNETHQREIPGNVTATALIDNVLSLCKLHDEHQELMIEQFLWRGDKTQGGLAATLSTIGSPRTRPEGIDDETAADFEQAAGRIYGLSARAFGQLVKV